MTNGLYNSRKKLMKMLDDPENEEKIEMSCTVSFKIGDSAPEEFSSGTVFTVKDLTEAIKTAKTRFLIKGEVYRGPKTPREALIMRAQGWTQSVHSTFVYLLGHRKEKE